MKSLGLLLFCLLLLSVIALADSPKKFVRAKIGREIYLLEVADTCLSRFRGLSARPSLKRNQGMVFVFDWLGQQQFTMRDMLFPLDFLWLDGEIVVALTERVPAHYLFGQARTVRPSHEVNKVIELYAGQINNSGVKIGDRIDFSQAAAD